MTAREKTYYVGNNCSHQAAYQEIYGALRA